MWSDGEEWWGGTGGEGGENGYGGEGWEGSVGGGYGGTYLTCTSYYVLHILHGFTCPSHQNDHIDHGKLRYFDHGRPS